MEKGPNMHRLTKTSEVGKKHMLIAAGARDTRINDAGSQYDGITIAEIAKLVSEPQATEKADAKFFIPSTYREHDGRSHAAQRERGEYWMLAIDVDAGDPSLTEVKTAVERVTGNASALIYSSSGASEDNRKWRALIPLSEPIRGEDYVDAQLALFDLMQQEGITCDAALSRTGQPIYLPNVPPARRDSLGQPQFYHGLRNRGEGLLIPTESKVWANLEFRRKNEAIAAERAAAERQLRAQNRAQQQKDFDGVDPVAEFNRSNTIADMMLRHGYEKLGRSDSYRSPMQTSGSHATKDFGTHWVSLSGSDRAAGIGQTSAEFCWGDAFDLYCYFEHDNDMRAAVRTYAAELRPTPTDVRESIVQQASDPYADFDTIPDLEPEKPKATIIIPNAEQKPIFWFKDAEPVLTSSYLVKGWLGRGQMSVVYGPSNVGKSFFCLDMALCISANVEWQGSKVKGGPVLYLATEGGNAFQSRCVALRKEYGIFEAPLAVRPSPVEYGIFEAPLAVRPSPVDLLRPEADLASLIELCKQIEADMGEPLAMIVIDTLSRAMAGGDENGPTDMTSFIANADALRDVTGAHIMIVHHSGKDTAKGARGHSSLRAATDTEIELEVDGKMRTAKATKQRDLEPQEPFVFTLKVHELGKDEDGDAVTTCTIEQADPDDVADMQQKRPSGANQKIIVSAFKQLRGEGVGFANPTGAGWPESGQFWCISENDLRKFASGKMTSTNASSAYATAMKALLNSGYMVQNEGFVWISAREGKVV
jgi:hypothetical protein